jgi:hypothetical protein
MDRSKPGHRFGGFYPPRETPTTVGNEIHASPAIPAGADYLGRAIVL